MDRRLDQGLRLKQSLDHDKQTHEGHLYDQLVQQQVQVPTTTSVPLHMQIYPTQPSPLQRGALSIIH